MPAPQPSNGAATSLATALRLLRERWWVLVVCVALGAGAFVVKDLRQEDEYEATATLLFGSAGSNVGGLINAQASNVSADPQRDQGTTLSLIGTTAVADRVKAALRYPGDAADLAATITASARADANLIDVTATDPDPGRAAELANAFAQQYQGFRRDTDRAGLGQGITSLTAQYDATPVTAAAQRQTLRDSITQLRSLAATTTGGVQLVDRATPPGAPASPRPKRDALLGALLGLALGVTVLFGLDLLDRRLRSPGDVEEAYGQPALVVVPLQRREPSTAAERERAAEPFRVLRVSLAQASTREKPHVVLVTSADPGEGKSTVAAGLARAVAFSGQRVALVELDLRRPSMHRQLSIPPDARGVVAVLRGEATIDDVLLKWKTQLPTLEVLPAGGTSPRSAELLSGPLISWTLDELMTRFDVVVLDAPPLLPVADTHALLDRAQIDTCLLVAEARQILPDHAARALATLRQHGRTRFGLVVNKEPSLGDAYDYVGASTGAIDLLGPHRPDGERPVLARSRPPQ